jgi:hypothetical protein
VPTREAPAAPGRLDQSRLPSRHDPEVVLGMDLEERPVRVHDDRSAERELRARAHRAVATQMSCAFVPGSTSSRMNFGGARSADAAPIENASSLTSIVQNPSVECSASRTGRPEAAGRPSRTSRRQ